MEERDRTGQAPPDEARARTASLLIETRGGSSEAADELYRRVSGKLLTLIRLRMGPSLRARLESRDILQAVLARSWQRIEQFDGADRNSLMAWLARIAQNEIRDQADRATAAKRDAGAELPIDELPTELPAAARSALSQVVIGAEQRRLERALEDLPEGQQELIRLRKLEELSWAEIAERLDKSQDACRMAHARAMAALTIRLERS